MLSKLHSVTIEGIEGILCEVEVDVSRGGFDRPLIVGLPDAAVRESVERVRSAIINSGFKYPDTQTVINLAPADVKKAGPAFDLPIAVGMLACSGGLQNEQLGRYVIVGELSLDGRVRPVNGILSMAMTAAAQGFDKMIVPLENASEAAVVESLDVLAVGSLAQTAAFLSGSLQLEPVCVDASQLFESCGEYETDFADVKGQSAVKRALIIAAAGGHNIMMIGPPGAGKTMLAQRLSTILPPLTLPEALETTRIYSSVGLLEKNRAIMATRPVRTPHHSASGPSLVGGGTSPRPGELSLAHNGILFLDEFAEFPRHVLEMIRQPLEEGSVTISRTKGTLRFPARFILIAAMNPCPCGYFGSEHRRCKCSPGQIERYLGKISGPLMDRIDIHIEVPAVEFGRLRSRSDGPGSAQLRKQVEQVRSIQTKRFESPLRTNAAMTHKQTEKFCELDSACQRLLKQAMTEFGLSARAHDKICRVSRTIADMEDCEAIRPEYIAEAIGYRRLDRKL